MEARQTAAVYRVNARLDNVQAGKLAFLAEATGLSASDVMREAVDRFYMQVKQEKGSKRPILDSLIGKFEGGPPDLSTNYKQYLTESLMKKHGYR
ncbi:MAG: CopG family transcriptional regulator [Betaproteobacteria bacterium]|nr:CopG family transcriptional regulator [Betaproteobacteria bacterium]